MSAGSGGGLAYSAAVSLLYTVMYGRRSPAGGVPWAAGRERVLPPPPPPEVEEV